MKSSLTLKLHPLRKNMNLRTANLFEKLFLVFICIIFLTYFSLLESLFAICFFIGLFKILTTILLGQLIANAKKRNRSIPTICSSLADRTHCAPLDTDSSLLSLLASGYFFVLFLFRYCPEISSFNYVNHFPSFTMSGGG